MSIDATTMPAVAECAAVRFGDAVAIVDGPISLSFEGLHEAVLAAAAAFAEDGLARGDRVAIWAPNCVGWIVACLGAQSAGGVVVPLNTRLKAAEAHYILSASRARYLITVRDFLGVDYTRLLDNYPSDHLRRVIALDDDWAAFATAASPSGRREAAARRAALGPSDASDILFTSGTTGRPKGVVATHGQSVRAFQIWSDMAGLVAGDRYLIVNPFFHTFGYKAGWLACLIKGAVIYPERTLDVARMIATIARERITVLPGPPTIFQSLLASDLAKTADLSSLRIAVTGAASVAPTLIERMREELRIETVLTAYGLTETCGLVTMSEAADSAEIVATTCGRAVSGVEVRCIDETGASVAAGEAGEVVVRGFNVMQGYFEDKAATRDAIDADGWLHTGDIGKLNADGYLSITDRLKDMYICGGFNCYPAEIERLMAAHPGIAQSAVIGVPDERLGEVGAAFVVLRPEADITTAELLAWCRETMANYKCPRQIQIVAALPTNASGKVLKFQLRGQGAG